MTVARIDQSYPQAQLINQGGGGGDFVSYWGANLPSAVGTPVDAWYWFTAGGSNVMRQFNVPYDLSIFAVAWNTYGSKGGGAPYVLPEDVELKFNGLGTTIVLPSNATTDGIVLLDPVISFPLSANPNGIQASNAGPGDGLAHEIALIVYMRQA